MGWMKTIWLLIVAFGIGVLLAGVLMGGGSQEPIIGTWHNVETGAGYCNLEFYENGLGTASLNYDKGIMPADDYGLSGSLKTLVIDLQYTKIGEKRYAAQGVSVYAESYTGQNRYVSESEFPGLDMGMFEIKRAGKFKTNLIWTLGNEEPDVFGIGKYSP